MAGYILRRLLLMIPTIFGIMAISFAIVQFAPGGPVERIIAQLQGHDAGAEDGLLGPGTRQALARYQQANGMVADGFPDQEVLTHIGVLP